jgi:hypothetical protein
MQTLKEILQQMDMEESKAYWIKAMIDLGEMTEAEAGFLLVDIENRL